MTTHAGRKKRLMIMFTLTFGYMLAELGVGYYAGSIALIADSFHMLSDVIALIVAFISIMVSAGERISFSCLFCPLIACLLRKLSPKSWSKSTFGWARAEVLGALINSVFLLALCFSIVMESVERFMNPKVIMEPIWVLVVGIGGLFVNLIGLFIFHEGHGHAHASHHHPLQHQGRLTRLVVPDEHGGLDSGVATPTNTCTPPESPKPARNSPPDPGSEQVSPRSNSPLISDPAGKTVVAAPSENDNSAAAGKTDVTVVAIPEPTKEMTKKEKKKEKAVRHSHQLNMRGVFLHILADTLGSVVVIISAGIVWATESKRTGSMDPHKAYVGNYKIIMYIDPMLSIIMVILITISSWPLLQETSMILLQTVPTYIDIEDVKRRLREKVSGILGIHEFHVWQLAGDRVIASIHIVCKNVADYIRISREAKDFFHENGIHSTTIQAEFLDYDNANEGIVFNDKVCLLNCPPDANQTVSCATSTCCGVTANDNKPTPPKPP